MFRVADYVADQLNSMVVSVCVSECAVMSTVSIEYGMLVCRMQYAMSMTTVL